MGVFVSVCSFRVISQHLNLFLFFLFLENMGCCYSCLPLASWTHELEVRVAQQFGNIGVIEREILSVNLRYLRSNGSRQLLGNGALVLTSDLLWFNYLRPANRRLAIHIQNIRAVNVGRFASGSIPAARMLPESLIINFFNTAKGVEDEVVFMSSDPSRWKALINETIHKSTNLLPPLEPYTFK